MNASVPAVTVVIPCHNDGAFVGGAVDSALAQTHPHVSEIVVIDDASDDPATRDVLAALDGGGVRVLRVPHGHVAAARNHGIRQARTPYVMVLDSDDRMEPDYLKETVALLEADGALAVAGSWLRTWGAAEWVVKPTGGGLTEFLPRNSCPGSSLLRRSCWQECGGYSEELRGDYEDWDYYLKVTSRGWRIAVVEAPLMRYHLAQGSLNTQGFARRPELVAEIVRRHLDTYRDHVVEAMAGKERILMQRVEELRDHLVRTPDAPLPEVTFGDGGLAFAAGVQALRDTAPRP
ncbi:glycosyltransferase family 2 protein [Streptomyces sp. 8L]|uniref:glycosyltransferase family 2 protein n=1 Tax=Streptomyces sp. 8L TaxID=2877242 RepID=UPI001CD764DE|nr:glycosyltransferase family A protein [Streptomyces sp. 8L]MCA1223784.1 glycosyltransferase family 2 protein [Streptomyces sp. 8L]